jgi:hypothetical protein
VNPVTSTLLSVLPGKRKVTQSGWISINSVCCHHLGHRRDTKGRGGVKIDGDAWVYSCFNCEFKAGWQPGKELSDHSKKLLAWMGVQERELGQLQLYCMKSIVDKTFTVATLDFSLVDKPLPKNTKPVTTLLDEGCVDPEFLEAVAYVLDRGLELSWYNWHWSSEKGYTDRIIIPFYHESRVVGWTGRKVTAGNKVKYLTSSNPGYVFNIDAQVRSRKFCIVVEGQIDAIAIDGVAIMHNDPSPVQCARLNNLGQEIIVVPDRDAAGAQMLTAALEHGWSVSLPPWGDDVKDVADAQHRFGRLYTLQAILYYRETNPIKIRLLQKYLENLE